MSSVEKKCDKREPFYLSPCPKKKTSAEIISEARRSLKAVSTRRPFTPKDDQRHLFGQTSSRSSEARPPSTFSLYARNFEESDSRPNSGKRLSPLEHKPKLPAPPDDDPDGPAALPRPPPDPLQCRRAGGSRPRPLKSCPPARVPPAKPSEECPKKKGSDSSPAEERWPAPCGDGNDPLKGRSLTGACSQGDRETARPRSPSGESGTSRPGSAETPVKSSAPATDLEGAEPKGQLEESAFWETRVAPLLQQLESVPQDGTDSVEGLCRACQRLLCILGEGDLLGRKCKRRAVLLRALFQLIDVDSARLTLELAKLILALSVSGNNLLNICKLVFKISRSENNDALFQNNSIVDSLLAVLGAQDVLSAGEAALYCVGTLKFLSGNRALLAPLVSAGCVPALLRLAGRLASLAPPGHAHFAVSGHILVQLTAALRNLVDLPETRPAFLSSGGFAELCGVLQHHHGDKDVCTNAARIFSKLSSYSECCSALASVPGCYGLFLQLLRRHQNKQDLVVRLVFTLGNLTAKNGDARERLWAEPGARDALLGLFLSYRGPDTPPAGGPAEAEAEGEGEDVLVKLIRVLANLSIHPDVGAALASDAQCVELLLSVLELRAAGDREELVVNAAAAVNNLSFYREEGSAVRANELAVARLMLQLLLGSSRDGMLEATRVFGNLSRSRAVRDFILKNKVHQFLVTLLDSKSPDVCFSACGVLVNLTADRDKRATLREEGLIQKLLDCLRDLGPEDWQLAGLLCQTLWNSSEDGAALCFSEQEAGGLLCLLTLYLDEELMHQLNMSEDVREVHQACWELEFFPVAQRLRNRIQSQGNLLEPLGAPS
ncbi:armadillo repeat-containing protein 2 [Anguilla rostrata]|uniref:armadillo repeat-containing protein 2 n=1 Tax=Anguilla rostrata TaxID=7938 RepID=UPI0030CC2F50